MGAHVLTAKEVFMVSIIVHVLSKGVGLCEDSWYIMAFTRDVSLLYKKHSIDRAENKNCSKKNQSSVFSARWGSKRKLRQAVSSKRILKEFQRIVAQNRLSWHYNLNIRWLQMPLFLRGPNETKRVTTFTFGWDSPLPESSTNTLIGSVKASEEIISWAQNCSEWCGKGKLHRSRLSFRAPASDSCM